MSGRRLSSMTTQELVELFEQISLVHGAATGDLEVGKANRAIEKLWKVLAELRHRNKDERVALLILYGHRHPQVRLNVAQYTYSIDSERAIRALQEIAESRLFPWAGEAGMSLSSLADGSSKLLVDPEFPPKRKPEKD